MRRPLEDYVALALIAEMTEENERILYSRNKEFSGSWSELKEVAEERLGFAITDEILQAAIRALSDCDLVRITDDQYSGMFIKIYSDRFSEFCVNADKQSEEAVENGSILDPQLMKADYRAAFAMESHQLFEDFKELGDEWVRRAIAGLRSRVEEVGSVEKLAEYNLSRSEVPASDRVVSLGHNEIIEFEEKTTEIINSLETKNQIDETEGLREILLGQAKAGRELIREGTFKIYALQVTLIETLKFLAKRYERETIGALAAALIAALTQKFGLTL